MFLPSSDLKLLNDTVLKTLSVDLEAASGGGLDVLKACAGQGLLLRAAGFLSSCIDSNYDICNADGVSMFVNVMRCLSLPGAVAVAPGLADCAHALSRAIFFPQSIYFDFKSLGDALVVALEASPGPLWSTDALAARPLSGWVSRTTHRYLSSLQTISSWY